MAIKHVVSVSGGKDSTATLLVALERFCRAKSRGTKITNKQTHAKKNNIWQVVEWAKTTRGGKQFDLLGDIEDVNACSSAYGLCE